MPVRPALLPLGLALGLVACSGSSSPSPGPTDAATHDAACTFNASSDCAGKCGQLASACGAIGECGTCPAGQACGGGGANVCGTHSCTATCAGKTCGASDGCETVCTAGSCPGGGTCDAGVCGE